MPIFTFSLNVLLVFGKTKLKGKNIFYLSKSKSLDECAKKLYLKLRQIKKLKYKMISVTKIPNQGIGIAINDRLKRASSWNQLKLKT